MRFIFLLLQSMRPDNQYHIKVIPDPSPGIYLSAKRSVNKKSNNCLKQSWEKSYPGEEKEFQNDFNKMIDLRKIAKGIYYFVVTVDNKIYLRKAIKEN